MSLNKSILKKMLLGSTIIVVVMFLLVSGFFIGYVEDNAIKDKAQLLENNIPRITDVSRVVFLNRSTLNDTIYRTVIDNISYNADASIIVFNNAGTILTVSGLPKSEYIGKTITSEIATNILNGERIVKKGILDSLYDGEQMLTVGSPMVSDGVIIGGVFLSTSIPKIASLQKGLFLELLVFLLVALVCSFILFYIVAKRIAVPVKRIDDAVGEFTKGDFSKRVEYSSEDELGRLADNINKMAESIEDMENMRTAFISDVSHELRTPMTAISGFVEGMLDGTIEPDERDGYLNIVLSESKRLSKLVDDLLQISRMEKNDTAPEKVSFDINELIRLVIIGFENPVRNKNIDVDLELCDDYCMVYAEKDSIKQVLINLVNNAVKFVNENGYIHIKVWVHQKKCYVEIKNSGDGIEKENLSIIWERFYKTDRSRSVDKSGVGLGLYIVKKIIDKHNEKIWATSTVGEFTSFTFSLDYNGFNKKQ